MIPTSFVLFWEVFHGATGMNLLKLVGCNHIFLPSESTLSPPWPRTYFLVHSSSFLGYYCSSEGFSFFSQFYSSDACKVWTLACSGYRAK